MPLSQWKNSAGQLLVGLPPSALMIKPNSSATIITQYYNKDGEAQEAESVTAGVEDVDRITEISTPPFENPIAVVVTSSVEFQYEIWDDAEAVPLGISNARTWPADTPFPFGPALGWEIPALEPVSIDSPELDAIEDATEASQASLASIDTKASAIETATEATQASTASIDTHAAAIETATEATQASADSIDTEVTAINAAIGAQADSAAGSDTGTFSVIAFIKRVCATYLAVFATNWTSLLAKIPPLVSGLIPILISAFSKSSTRWKYAAGSSGITTATTTTIKAAAGSGVVNNVQKFSISNSHASQAVKCTLQDGAANVLWRETLNAGAGREFIMPMNNPLESAANSAIELVTDAAGVIWFNAAGDTT